MTLSLKPAFSDSKDAPHQQAIGVDVVVNHLHATNGDGQRRASCYDVQLAAGARLLSPKASPAPKTSVGVGVADTLPAGNGCKDATFAEVMK